jgi:hypothetical protein
LKNAWGRNRKRMVILFAHFRLTRNSTRHRRFLRAISAQFRMGYCANSRSGLGKEKVNSRGRQNPLRRRFGGGIARERFCQRVTRIAAAMPTLGVNQSAKIQSDKTAFDRRPAVESQTAQPLSAKRPFVPQITGARSKLRLIQLKNRRRPRIGGSHESFAL